VFTARYALSPHIKQIRFVFKGLIFHLEFQMALVHVKFSSHQCHWPDVPETQTHYVHKPTGNDTSVSEICFLSLCLRDYKFGGGGG
jgi:hypothetical protein